MHISVLKSQDLGRRAGGGGGLAPRPPWAGIQHQNELVSLPWN